jgi:hypothetical protein
MLKKTIGGLDEEGGCATAAVGRSRMHSASTCRVMLRTLPASSSRAIAFEPHPRPANSRIAVTICVDRRYFRYRRYPRRTRSGQRRRRTAAIYRARRLAWPARLVSWGLDSSRRFRMRRELDLLPMSSGFHTIFLLTPFRVLPPHRRHSPSYVIHRRNWKPMQPRSRA